jgi:hypothetical protein
MLSRSALARYILVAFVSAFVAVALTAPAVNARNGGFSELILACFESRDADSEYCRLALTMSPVDHNFFWRLGDNLLNPLPEPEVDIKTLVKACAATQDLESEECVRAIEASGLSVEDFKSEWAAKLGYLAKTYPYEKGEKTDEYQMSALMKECLQLKAWLNGRTADELAGKIEKINYVCGKALKESQMTAAQFWTKYR